MTQPDSIKTESYVYRTWLPSHDDGLSIHHSMAGERIVSTGRQGVDFARALEYGRTIGGPGRAGGGEEIGERLDTGT